MLQQQSEKAHVEDTAGYKEMLRMNHGNFCKILEMIEPYIYAQLPMGTLGTARALSVAV